MRDVAAWAPKGATEQSMFDVVQRSAGGLLVRLEFIDRFEKDGRASYAYRLVFQSFERTLTDEEANAAMDTVSAALTKAGYEVR